MSAAPIKNRTAESPAGIIKKSGRSARNSRPSVSVVTLGCVRNTVDSENLAGALVAGGAVLSAEPEQSDVVIINTCGFIGPAKAESTGVIRDMLRLKKSAGVRRVYVMGCLVQRDAETLKRELPGVDGFYPIGAVREIAGELGLAEGCHHAQRAFASTGHYAYLKISEGCDYRCSFCVIPFIRGPHRSRPIPELVAEAQRLAAHGVRELVVVAEDTAYYGTDLDGRADLCDVLRALNGVDGLAWIRVMYLHPARTTQAMIDTIAELDKVVPYLDMPMQHASTPVLKRMRRQSSEEMLYDLVDRIRRTIPGVALRTTMLVGYPGETEDDFQVLERFVRDAQFERLGVFTYSPEEGAAAFRERPLVPAPVMEERRHRLMSAQQEISLARNQALVGQVIPVLIDAPDPDTGGSIGRTPWDAPDVDNSVAVSAPLPPGVFVPVLVKEAEAYTLRGEAVETFEGVEPSRRRNKNEIHSHG